MDMLQNYSNTGCQRLHITAPLGLTQSYITKLFNLIPGLEYCDLNEQTGNGKHIYFNHFNFEIFCVFYFMNFLFPNFLPVLSW